MLSLRALECLVTIVKQGSPTKAAAVLAAAAEARVALAAADRAGERDRTGHFPGRGHHPRLPELHAHLKGQRRWA